MDFLATHNKQKTQVYNNRVSICLKKITVAVVGLFLGFGLPNTQPVMAQTVRSLSNSLANFLNSVIIPLLVGVALLVFIAGLVGYILQAGDEGAVEKGKQRMIWGTVSMFVITSVWGIVQFISAFLRIN